MSDRTGVLPRRGSAPPTPFLDRRLTDAGPRSGYVFRLLVSPNQGHFVYWAEPAPASQSGERAFCVTETATVQAYPDYRSRGPLAPSDPDEGCPAGGRTL